MPIAVVFRNYSSGRQERIPLKKNSRQSLNGHLQNCGYWWMSKKVRKFVWFSQHSFSYQDESSSSIVNAFVAR